MNAHSTHTQKASVFFPQASLFPMCSSTLYSGILPVVTFQTVSLNIPNTAVPNPPSTLNLQKDHATYNHFQYCQGHKPLALIWHRLKTILSHPYWSHHSVCRCNGSAFIPKALKLFLHIYRPSEKLPWRWESRMPTVSHVSAYAQGSLQHSHWKNHNRSNMFSEKTFTPTVILLIFVCSVLEKDAYTKFAEFAI